MMHVGLAIYAACVDFMIHAADLFGVTYRDANAFLFFVLWPAVTVMLLVTVAVQWRTLRRLRATPERTARRRSPGR